MNRDILIALFEQETGVYFHDSGWRSADLSLHLNGCCKTFLPCFQPVTVAAAFIICIQPCNCTGSTLMLVANLHHRETLMTNLKRVFWLHQQHNRL